MNGRQAIAVDNTDWLKTAAIALVFVDHLGHYFIEHDQWYRVVGRLAAPTFFFLMGYAQTRIVPIRWIWYGIILTVLASWNNDWNWVVPNILLSFALIRVARPYVQKLAKFNGWATFAILITVLCAALPIAGDFVEYGTSGWLWALFGFYLRDCVQIRKDPAPIGETHNAVSLTSGTQADATIKAFSACLIAAVVYVWQEQISFSFSHKHLATLIFGVGLLSIVLCLFRRGPSSIQPPKLVARTINLTGRYTLEIYAIQLAASELIIKLRPDLAT